MQVQTELTSALHEHAPRRSGSSAAPPQPGAQSGAPAAAHPAGGQRAFQYGPPPAESEDLDCQRSGGAAHDPTLALLSGNTVDTRPSDNPFSGAGGGSAPQQASAPDLINFDEEQAAARGGAADSLLGNVSTGAAGAGASADESSAAPSTPPPPSEPHPFDGVPSAAAAPRAAGHHKSTLSQASNAATAGSTSPTAIQAQPGAGLGTGVSGFGAPETIQEGPNEVSGSRDSEEAAVGDMQGQMQGLNVGQQPQSQEQQAGTDSLI